MLWRHETIPEPIVRIRGLSCRLDHLGGILSIGLLFVLPVILADTYYMDDAPRSMNGYGWTKSGRPLASLLMAFLGFRSRNIPDLAPLGQIAGMAFLACSAWIFAARLCEARQDVSPTQRLLCALPVFVQPFFLENLSYRYDCLPMCLAQGTAFLAPALFGKSTRSDALALATATLLILTTYQIGVDSLLAASCLIFVRACQDGDAGRGVRVFGFQILCLAPTIIAYRIVVSPLLHGDYTNDHDRMFGPKDGILTGLFDNMRATGQLLGCFGFDAASVLLYGLFGMAVCMVWSLAVRVTRDRDHAAGAVLFLVPVILLACVPGLTLLLHHSVIEPRTLMGFSGVIGLIGLMLSGQRYMRAVACLPLVFCLTLSFAYGNALHERNCFDDALAQSLTDRLFALGYMPGDRVMIYGPAPISPVVANAIAIFPALDRLLPRDQMGDDGFFATARLLRHGLPVAEHDAEAWRAARTAMAHLAPVYRDARYAIFHDGAVFCVVFPERRA